MQIKEFKVSNLLSFPYLPNFEQEAANSFAIDWKCSGIAILIWDNASGKTNYLRILEEFHANFVANFSYNRGNLQDNQQLNSVIRKVDNKTKNLETNYNTQNLESKIEITIELSNHDYENIGFVCKYADQINAIIKKYSELDLVFEKKNLEILMKSWNTIKILAVFDEKEQSFSLNDKRLSDDQKFALKCLKYHQLLQIVIMIFNERERKANERKRYLLKNTFSFIWNDRSFLEYENFLNPVTLVWDKYSYRNSLSGYTNFIYKVWSILEDFSQGQLLSSPLLLEKKIDDSMQYLRNSDFFLEINKIIRKYFHKEIGIDYVNGVIDIKLIDRNWNINYFNDLSDGEQSLLALFFGFFWNDLEHGCMIISEPELHVHPYIQKGLAEVLHEISEKKGTQFIITTNSPLFINDKNITNVYRVFRTPEKWSQIIAPKIVVDSDDAKLMHMLKFENLSKIFFVDKILLVEWDTDAYFFSFYLDYLSKMPEWEEKVGDFEIININWKGWFKPWRRFLNKFQINNFFIGDWDNTVDYGFFSRAEINRYYQIANQLKRNQKRKTNNKLEFQDYYNKLVKTIMTFNPGKHKAIIRGIEKLYNDNIFILKEGAIESYVPLERKGFPYMVSFCNNNFHEWLKDPYYEQQRSELLGIVKHVFWK